MLWRKREKIKKFHKGIFPLLLPLAASAISAAAPAAAAGGMSAGMGMLYGGLASGASGLLGGFLGGGDDKTRRVDLQTKKLDEFPESDQARQDIAARLQEWGGQSGYGAIEPDWGDIWERAKGKVNRFYWGGVGNTGLAGKVKASAARRGVSESPALETQLTRMGMQEGLELKDIASEQALQEALFGERGRQNWFGQMQDLARMKPSYASSGSLTTVSGGGPSTGELVGELGSAVGTGLQQYSQNKWLEDYLTNMSRQNKLGLA